VNRLPVLERTYDLLRWLVPAVAQFPREQRYLLGERIERDADSGACGLTCKRESDSMSGRGHTGLIDKSPLSLLYRRSVASVLHG